MKASLPLVVLALFLAPSCAPVEPPQARPALRWEEIPALPQPRSNLALAGSERTGKVFACLGLDASKRWEGIRREAFAYDPAGGTWRAIPPLPGAKGRLASAALALRGRLYVFGGYTVDAAGAEVSLARVDVFDPASGRWSTAAPMPRPVDDSVVLAWRDRFALLVSGWSQEDNVREVQVYDADTDTWRGATPIPGRPVFGHAGALVGDRIVYCDGVRVDERPPEGRSRFVMERSCWEGRVSSPDATRIAWRRLPDHPGPARYRMAAGALGDWVLFVGGSTTAYNYDGVGYEGEPARPAAGVFAWDLRGERWLELGPAPLATMDHRALAALGPRLYLVGGMTERQAVSGRAFRIERAR